MGLHAFYDRFFHLPLPEGCFLTVLFALEPNSATPSTPILGLQVCGATPAGSLYFQILRKDEIDFYYASVPVGIFADGDLHEIAVSITRKSHAITFYLDQKIMSTHSYADDNGYSSGEMPTFATGKVFLGAAHIPWKDWRYLPGFIGKMKNAYVDTDNRLPYQDMYKVVGFNERGYGSCIGYSDGLVDQGLCGDFYETDELIFMSPQRFRPSVKAMLDGIEILGQFVSAECRDTWMKYSCGSYIMPCATYEHDGIEYSFPRSPCRSQCETFMAACRDDLIDIENILHAVPDLRAYTAKLWDTFCDLTVDSHCNGEPDAPLCVGEQYRFLSPVSYVDIFQRQQAHPVEGSLLPDGGIIPCASNNASYSGRVECPQGFSPYTGTETEHLCVFPCVSFLYTREQLDSQFTAYVATGLTGMVANFSLIAWYSSSFLFEWIQRRRGKKKKGWSTLPTFVFVCAVLGFLFGVIDTIPAALLKFDLPCSDGCTDEFCHGSGLACKVAQPSEYLLLLVFCILLGTLVEVYMDVILKSPPPRSCRVKRYYSMGVFVMMLIVVFACVFADSGALATESDEYRQRVVARDIFSCGPRYSSLVQELVFLTLPFTFVCLALVGVTIGMIVNIWKAVMRVRDDSHISRSVNKFGKVAGKLMALGVVVFVLWVVRASIAAGQEPIIANFYVDARKWADCMKQKAAFETAVSQVVFLVKNLPGSAFTIAPHPSQICFFFDPQFDQEVEDCDAIPDAGTSMWTARVLSIIVKNMQSYIVAVVWGVAEVLSLCKGRGDKCSTHKKDAPINGKSSFIFAASVAVDN
jgi:hypothetical protein